MKTLRTVLTLLATYMRVAVTMAVFLELGILSGVSTRSEIMWIVVIVFAVMPYNILLNSGDND